MIFGQIIPIRHFFIYLLILKQKNIIIISISSTFLFDIVFQLFRYPCSKTIHLLIQFGVDIDQMDKERNTSLHLLIKTNDKSSQIYQLIDLIYHYGHAHLDFLNIYNQTPIQLTNQTQIQKYLKDKKKIFNLKCLCATFIQLKQIPFQFYLNKSLSQFVSKH